jgi:hypothetical protein
VKVLQIALVAAVLFGGGWYVNHLQASPDSQISRAFENAAEQKRKEKQKLLLGECYERAGRNTRALVACARRFDPEYRRLERQHGPAPQQ